MRSRDAWPGTAVGHASRRPFRFCPYCAAALQPEWSEGRLRPVCAACGFVAPTGDEAAGCTTNGAVADAVDAVDASSPPLVAFVGHSGSGKTTLVEQIIRELAGRGLRIAAIKHDPKGHATYDIPGKDSWRYQEAGGTIVALAGPATVARFQRVAEDQPLPLLARELAAGEPVDVILAEGYHMQSGFPKIEVYRPALGRPPRCTAKELIAVATDSVTPVAGLAKVPHLPLNEPAVVAQFALQAATTRGAHAAHPIAHTNRNGAGPKLEHILIEPHIMA